METAAAIIIDMLLSAFVLWVGMKFTGVSGSFFSLVVIVGISTPFSLIPLVGWIISIFVLFFLICKWTSANFFPDAVLMVIVSKAVGFIGVLLLAPF